jgi:hypothetical protein
MIINWEERIEEILSRVYKTDHDNDEAAWAYTESFQHEGLRKASFVIDRLKGIEGLTDDLLKDFTALSVGGADGSDLLAIIESTPIRRAILLEYDNAAAELANRHIKPLIEAKGGSLDVIIGDAVQQLEPLVARLKTERKRGSTGLLSVFFGVLHELPRRSPQFELRHYISRLATAFNRNLFFLSEPCLPPNVEDEVEVRVSTISEDRLYELLDHINAHLFNNEHEIRKLSEGYVRAGFPLVMEMLHKLLRFDTIPRFRHEMGERLTQFTSDQFVAALQIALPRAFIERTELVSQGFQIAFWSADVELRTINAQLLVTPFSHVRVSAMSLPQQPRLREQEQLDKREQERRAAERPPEQPPADLKAFGYADSSLADVDFPMPADSPVTEIILALRSYSWYKQSPAIEKIFTKLNWADRTQDEAFVIGRNIYQCAEGDENHATEVMNDLRRQLAKIPDEWAVHILNGMFYEAYFDPEGAFRDIKLKKKHLAKLFAIERSGKFANSIAFIHAALEPHRNRLGVLPSTSPERLEAKVALDHVNDPAVITSITCNGVEQTTPAKEDAADPAWELSNRPVGVEKFKSKLEEFWNIPEGRLDLSFDKDVSGIEKIRLPEGRTIQHLHM